MTLRSWLALGALGGASVAALAGLAVPLIATAGEFLAFPGLWKTVVQLAGPSVTPHEPAVQWHCVDEAADPWSAFGQIALPAGDVCRQTRSERTATTLAWTVECKGPAAIASIGRIVFDSASHYRGEVELSGSFMGYPVSSRVTVEGQRYAACTSPAD